MRMNPPVLLNRVTFDPPLTIHNGEVLSVKMKQAGDGIEIVDAQVLTPKQQAQKLHASILETVKGFLGGIRLREIPDEMERQGFFDAGDLMEAIFCLIAVRKLDLSANNIITIHTPQE